MKQQVNRYYFDIMVGEHIQIRRMLRIIRIACFEVYNGSPLDYELFGKLIDFVRNYADKYHHGKEEDCLFDKMEDNLGEVAEKFIRSGMLVEHDMGRLYMMDLESALESYKKGDEEAVLDVIANAISYTHLLNRHINKENDVIYPYAQNNLSDDVQDLVDEQCRQFEEDNVLVKEKYLSLIDELEERFNIRD